MTTSTSPAQGDAPGWRRQFERVDAGIGAFIGMLSVGGGLAALLIMAVLTGDVIFRNTFGVSVRGAFELVELLLVLAVFLGMANAERKQAHVRVMLVTSSVPPRVGEAMRLLGLFVSLVIVCWFVYSSGLRAAHSWRIGEYQSGLLRFPLYPGRMIIAVGFALLALELVMSILRRCIALSSGSAANTRVVR